MKKNLIRLVLSLIGLGALAYSSAHSDELKTELKTTIHLDMGKGARNGVAFRTLIDKSVGKNVSISGYLGILVQTQGLAALFSSEADYERMINSQFDPDAELESRPIYTSIYFDENETLIEYEKYHGKNVELTDVLLPSINDGNSVGAIWFSNQTKIRDISRTAGGLRVGSVKRKLTRTNVNETSSIFLAKIIEEATGARTNADKERFIYEYASAANLHKTQVKRARYVLYSGPFPLYEKFTSIKKLNYFTYDVKDERISFPVQFSCACEQNSCPKNPMFDADLPYPVNKLRIFCLQFVNYFDQNLRRDNWLTDFYD